MGLLYNIVTVAIREFFTLTCRIDNCELSHVPLKGPFIIISNHINFLEVPVLFSQLYPRHIIGVAKQESWEKLPLRTLFNIWRVIPIKRGEVDLAAMHKSIQVLKEGNIIAISPEGTRSYNGRLQRGLPGVLLLALKSQVPILPIAHYGGENFWENFKRFRRTDFHIRVGQMFRLKNLPTPTPKDVREQVMTEMMIQLAALLPPQYRGVYSDLENATQEYIEFLPPE